MRKTRTTRGSINRAFCSNFSSRVPTNFGSISHVLAHVSPDQMPSGPSGHAHEIGHFADISSYPRSPSLCHPRLHHGIYQNTTPQYERSRVSTGHQNISQLRRPDTMIHIYQNQPTPIPAVAVIAEPLCKLSLGNRRITFSTCLILVHLLCGLTMTKGIEPHC